MNKFKLWLFRLLGIRPKCTHEEIIYTDEGEIFSRENTCTVGGFVPVGDWLPPEPHPIPKFRDSIKIQRRPVAAVLHCKKCGFVGVTKGFDQRDISEELGGTLPVVKSRLTSRTSPHAIRNDPNEQKDRKNSEL